jgi:hypothetical protein
MSCVMACTDGLTQSQPISHKKGYTFVNTLK